jgi:hypothetical protein
MHGPMSARGGGMVCGGARRMGTGVLLFPLHTGANPAQFEHILSNRSTTALTAP